MLETEQHAPSDPAPGQPLISVIDEFLGLLMVNPDAEAPDSHELGARFLIGDVPSSLAGLQAIAIDPSRSRLDHVLTARYRITAPPHLGTALVSFARDLASVLTNSDAPVGEFAFREGDDLQWLSAVETALPKGNAPEGSAGSLDLDWVADLGSALAKATGIARIILLVEASSASDGRLAERDWALMPDILERLPRRMIIVATPVSPWPSRLDWDEIIKASILTHDWHPLEESQPGALNATGYQEQGLRGDAEAHDDALGFREYARAFARFVLHPETNPVTIGIQGPWGKGKSTFMRFIGEALIESSKANPKPSPEVPAAITVQFNAWQYQDSPQIWAGLATAITRAAEDATPRVTRWRRRISFWLRRSAWVPMVTIAIVVAFVVAMVVVANVDAAAEFARGSLPPWANVLGSALLPVAAAAYLAWILARAAKPVAVRLADIARAPHGARMGYQHEVIRDLAFVRDKLVGPSRRIVVFVDDLDRCSEDRVVDVLQAINLILAKSGFFVFLGIDGHMVHRAIDNHYRGSELGEGLPEDFGRKYLRKIIQLSFDLPRTPQDNRIAFIRSLFPTIEGASAGTPDELTEIDSDVRRPGRLEYDLSTVQPPIAEQMVRVKATEDEVLSFEALQDFMADNPRETIRLINVHRLAKIMLTGSSALPSEERRRKLVKWLVFCARWPSLIQPALELAAELRASPDVISRLVQEAREQRDHLPRRSARSSLILEDTEELMKFAVAANVRLTAADLLFRSEFERAASLSELVEDDSWIRSGEADKTYPGRSRELAPKT